MSKEDISKIIDTYKGRKEEERYSKKVSIEEIEKNDFNLNITRYVSTAVPDVQIDINEVHKTITEIENQLKRKKEKTNKFLKELGLKPLV